MKFAVNYSAEGAELLRQRQIELDLFKCPAWPDLLPEARALRPAYVHFPLIVGLGMGDAFDAEAKRPADWRRVEAIFSRTDTIYLNLHLSLIASDYPDIPRDTADPAHIEALYENALRDVHAVVARFGPERVIVENDHSNAGLHMCAAFQPGFVRQLIDDVGCGFLFDLSHARLAAGFLGVPHEDYIRQLPLGRIREIHVTGIHHINEEWSTYLQTRLSRLTGQPSSPFIDRYRGQLLDHLPMTDEDWRVFEWALGEIRAGRWSKPDIVAFEYSGVGGFFEATTERDVLLEQIPRFYDLIHGVRV